MLNFIKNTLLGSEGISEDVTMTPTKATKFDDLDGKQMQNEKTVFFSIFALFRCLSAQQRYVTLFGAFVFNFVIGGYLAIGDFIPYMASYLTASQLDYNVTSCDAQAQAYYASNTAVCGWLLTAWTIGYAGCGCVGGLLQMFWSTRNIVFLGGSFATVSFLVAYYHTSSMVVVMLCSFGMMYGIGCGLAWSPTIVCAIRWFPDSKGMMSGLIMSAIAAGSICFSLIETNFINPNNNANDPLCGYALQPEIYEQVPASFMVVAVFTLCGTLVGVVCISDAPPPQNGAATEPMDTVTIEAMEPSVVFSRSRASRSRADDEFTPINKTERAVYVDVNVKEEACKKRASFVVENVSRDFTIKEALSSTEFWIIFFNILCMVQLLCWTYTDWKLFAETYVQIEDDSFLLKVNVMAAVCNLCGRIIWGNLYDRMGSYRKTMWINGGLSLVTILTLPLCSTKSMTIAWVSMLWFCISATYVIMAPVIANTFGDKYCAMLTGIVMVAEIFSTSLQSTIFTVIQNLNLQEDKKWLTACFLNGSFVVIALIITCKFKDRPQTKKQIMLH